MPRFEFLLDDLTRVDESDLQARDLTAPALLTVLMLGAAADNSGILGRLVAWRAYFGQLLDWPGGDQIFEGLITYTLHKANVTLDDLQRVFAPLGTAAQEALMTTAEKLEARGEARGEVRGQAKLLVRLLTRKFGPLPEAVRTTIASASIQRLDEWADRLLTATTLDEIFG